jgi:hypothetical protein
MTDRIHSCKESPDGKHRIVPGEYGCYYCHRTVSYLQDMGWNAPLHDPDQWDHEADVNDAPSARFLQ